MTLSTFLPNLPTILIAVAVTLGGLWVFRQSYAKQLGEMQEQLIATQEKQIRKLKQENIAMKAAFRHLGIEIEIDDEEITLIESSQSKRTRIVTVPVPKDSTTKNGKTREESA